MFARVKDFLKREWLVALGFLSVSLGGIVDLLDQLGAIDITPLVQAAGADTGVVLASIGVAKIVLRLAYGGVAYLLLQKQPKQGDTQ